MKKHNTSKAKLIRTHSVVEIDQGDIIQWLRGRAEIPKDAKNIFVGFTLHVDDALGLTEDRLVEMDSDRLLKVTWTEDKEDDTGF